MELIKTKISQKCSLSTPTINESYTQTEIFCLLKEGKFTQVKPESKNSFRIKQKCLVMKQPINALFKKENIEQVRSEDEKFKQELDNLLEKMFPYSTEIISIKDLFIQDKKTRIKIILNQLQIDFEQCIRYDEDGLMGIHRAIINNNLQQVQKHIILLKATGKNIDICSQDDKTSLELAAAYSSDPQIIKLLLTSGAQPVSSKRIHNSAIIIAAENSSGILSLLLDYVNENNRLLLNSKNSEGFAAIHYCAMKGNLHGIIKLLQYGAEVNLQDDRSGKTALFYALDTKSSEVNQDTYFDIAFKLLEYGATSNLPTFSKHTVLLMIDDIKNHSLKIALNKAVK